MGKLISLAIIQGEKANIITAFNSSDHFLNKLVVGKPLLGSTSDYIFIYNGEPFRNSYVGGSDILVIQKAIIKSYVATSTIRYNDIRLHRNDYFDSIKVSLYVDSIMRKFPIDWKDIDSLYKIHLADFSSKDTVRKKK
jgi:hypothetical protein